MDSNPVQRLMSKGTKTTLPIARHLLDPEIQPDVEEKLTRKQRRAKKYFDRGAEELPELDIGQPVRMKTSPIDSHGRWRRGICVKKVAPRSYVVEVDGSLFRRNRKFLRTTKDYPAPAQSDPGQNLALHASPKPRTLESDTKERVPIPVMPSEPSPDFPSTAPPDTQPEMPRLELLPVGGQGITSPKKLTPAVCPHSPQL